MNVARRRRCETLHDEPLSPEAKIQPTVGQAQLCGQWEAEAVHAGQHGVRVTTLRLGLVQGADGGSYPLMTTALRCGLGMLLGRGTQWMSWVHIEDVVGLITAALEDPRYTGAINAVAPGSVSHWDFMGTVAARLKRPLLGSVPAAPLRLVLGEMATLLVDGQRILPARALELGYAFKFPTIGAAVEALEHHPDPPRQLEVFYNGACPVCDAEMEHYKRTLIDDKYLSFVDVSLRAGVLADYGLRFEHVKSRLHVRTGDGQVFTGMDAMRAVWERVPGIRRLVPLTRMPGLRLVLDALYDSTLAPYVIWLGKRRCATTARAGR